MSKRFWWLMINCIKLPNGETVKWEMKWHSWAEESRCSWGRLRSRSTGRFYFSYVRFVYHLMCMFLDLPIICRNWQINLRHWSLRVENLSSHALIFWQGSIKWGLYRVSKKIRCWKWQYFTNGTIYQCNILQHGNYDFYLGVCKVSIQYVKSNWTYDRERNDGSKGSWMIKYACVYFVVW